jgi:NAD(P)-dependent dehydrogenase (short-subunit alcohol dehydrogenase family)
LAPMRVNVVSPGWVDTPMFEQLAGDMKSELFETMAARLPAGKIATPADIAPAYVYAMESEFTTGQTLDIDGGQSLV